MAETLILTNAEMDQPKVRKARFDYEADRVLQINTDTHIVTIDAGVVRIFHKATGSSVSMVHKLVENPADGYDVHIGNSWHNEDPSFQQVNSIAGIKTFEFRT